MRLSSRLVHLAVLSIALLFASSAFAQDGANPGWEAEPLYGTVDLVSGFMPDPHSTDLSAGGSDMVEIPGCSGYINAVQPDVDLNYEAGGFPLHIYVVAEEDTTLVVFGPDMQWYCDDDTSGFNPAVSFETPASGNYNIWVGVWGEASTAPAVLNISELDPAWPAAE